MMIEGAVETQVWNLDLERFLVPELKPGESVMLDQVSFHGSLRAIGLNPVELPRQIALAT